MISLQVRSFQMSKLGNKSADCEDSFSADPSAQRFAMADGASSSLFSDIWARSLTQTAIEAGGDIGEDSAEEKISEIMLLARNKWYSSIPWDSLPWFLKNKAVSGSYSTLLITEFHRLASSYGFTTLAVGDTCIFKVSHGEPKFSFPLSEPREFNNSPKLVWSGKGNPLPEKIRLSLPKHVRTQGIVSPGEKIVLATDAIAKWMLEFQGFDRIISAIGEHDVMKRFVSSEINNKRMRNDDITVAVIQIKK